MTLENRCARVTGAASGIGKEVARQLLAEGAKVAIADLRLDAVQCVAQELDPSGARAIAVAMDVADEGQVEAGFEEAARRLGGIDILVSNAGVQVVAPLEAFAFADWKRMLAIHLDGAFLTTR